MLLVEKEGRGEGVSFGNGEEVARSRVDDDVISETMCRFCYVMSLAWGRGGGV